MKICLVTFDFPPLAIGGIGTQSYGLASSLSREGIDVCVLTAGKQDEEECLTNSVKVIRLKVPIHSKLRKIPTFQFRAWQWLKCNNKNFDVVHFQETAGFLYFLSNLFNKKGENNTIEHFHHSHISEFIFHLKFLFKVPRDSLPYLFMPVSIFQEYISLKMAKRVVAVSNNSCSTLLSWGIDPSKIVVIPNAISESSFRDGGKTPLSGPVRFLCVGRLVPRKGIDILIEAIVILHRNGVNNFFVDVVGQGPLFKYCQKRIKDLRNCHMWGLIPQQKLERLYREADCFICPSRLEGFGIVLLEAAANNLAIVANDIPVFREIFSDNEALYFEQNSPYDLAEKILELINKPNLISVRQVKARNKIKYYTWQNVVKNYVSLYSSMISR